MAEMRVGTNTELHLATAQGPPGRCLILYAEWGRISTVTSKGFVGPGVAVLGMLDTLLEFVIEDFSRFAGGHCV